MSRLQEKTERNVYRKALEKKPELLELAEAKLKLLHLERILLTLIVVGILSFIIWLI
jgi:cell division protein FtsL